MPNETPTIAELHALLIALTVEVSALRQEVAALRTSRPRASRMSGPPAPPAPPAPAPQTLDEWTIYLPNLGDDLSRREVAAHLDRPRVKPADIELTAADHERNHRPRPVTHPAMVWRVLGMLIMLGALIALVLFLS